MRFSSVFKPYFLNLTLVQKQAFIVLNLITLLTSLFNFNLFRPKEEKLFS